MTSDYSRTAGRPAFVNEYLLDDERRERPELKPGWEAELSDGRLMALYDEIEELVERGGAYFDGSDYEYMLDQIDDELANRADYK